jgi:hypothetical protein
MSTLKLYYTELQKLHYSGALADFTNTINKPEFLSVATLLLSILDTHGFKKCWISSKDLLSYKLLESYIE